MKWWSNGVRGLGEGSHTSIVPCGDREFDGQEGDRRKPNVPHVKGGLEVAHVMGFMATYNDWGEELRSGIK